MEIRTSLRKKTEKKMSIHETKNEALIDACFRLEPDEVAELITDRDIDIFFKNKNGSNAMIETVNGIRYTRYDRESDVYRAIEIMKMLTNKIGNKNE